MTFPQFMWSFRPWQFFTDETEVEFGDLLMPELPAEFQDGIGCGDLVLYDGIGVCFEGTVVGIEEATDKLVVSMSDAFGARTYRVGRERCLLLIKAEALEATEAATNA